MVRMKMKLWMPTLCRSRERWQGGRSSSPSSTATRIHRDMEARMRWRCRYDPEVLEPQPPGMAQRSNPNPGNQGVLEHSQSQGAPRT